MGNKKKETKWLPAEPLRIKAFARAIAFKCPEVQEPKAKDVQRALSKYFSDCPSPPEKADATIRSWLTGKKRPDKSSVNWIKQKLPECVTWLEPSLETPILRFICALDMCGSPMDSPIRGLDTSSPGITVGKGLASLAKHWAPVWVKDSVMEFTIPRLNQSAPYELSRTVYQSFNPLSLMDFMFLSGAYLEFSDQELFMEWAIDLASLTLMVGAFLEGRSVDDQMLSSNVAGYNWSVYLIFFRGHGNWPNLESVREKLEESVPELCHSTNYHHRLMQARDVLKQKLKLTFGCDLSIVEELSRR